MTHTYTHDLFEDCINKRNEYSEQLLSRLKIKSLSACLHTIRDQIIKQLRHVKRE